MDLHETNLIDLADAPHRPQKGSKASTAAKRLGLTYLGFGRYGLKNKDGKIHVTHHVKKDQLYPVTNDGWAPKTDKDGKPVRKIVPVPKEFGSWKEKYGKRYEKNVQTAPRTFDNMGGGYKDREELTFDVDKQIGSQQKKILKYNKEKYSKELGKDLRSKQTQAVLDHFLDTTDDVNKHLYTSPDPDRFKHRTTAWKIRKMDALLKRPELKSEFDYSVYTGTMANLEKGKKYAFKGFLSTSLSPSAAAEFMTKTKEAKKTMIQIDIKKGQPVLDMNAAMEVAHNAEAANGFEAEQEHLLPRNTHLKVIEGPLHMEDGVYFRAEIVSDHEDEDE